MADLAVITPTRGRPDRFAELVAAVRATAVSDVEIWVGLDDDDPADYFNVVEDPLGSHMIIMDRGTRRSLSAWTNHLADRALEMCPRTRYLASLGDDHRPRTKGWDRILIDAIEAMDGPGFAYGNDLFQGVNMPTAWVVSADAVRAVGWMMLPTLEHMYVDNTVLELGRAAGRIVYRPDAVVEHMHPLAGKAQWDPSYRTSNTEIRYAADKASFEAWKRVGLAGDVERLLACVGAVR